MLVKKKKLRQSLMLTIAIDNNHNNNKNNANKSQNSSNKNIKQRDPFAGNTDPFN